MSRAYSICCLQDVPISNSKHNSIIILVLLKDRKVFWAMYQHNHDQEVEACDSSWYWKLSTIIVILWDITSAHPNTQHKLFKFVSSGKLQVKSHHRNPEPVIFYSLAKHISPSVYVPHISRSVCTNRQVIDPALLWHGWQLWHWTPLLCEQYLGHGNMNTYVTKPRSCHSSHPNPQRLTWPSAQLQNHSATKPTPHQIDAGFVSWLSTIPATCTKCLRAWPAYTITTLCVASGTHKLHTKTCSLIQSVYRHWSHQF